MVTQIQLWQPKECGCQIIFAFDTKMVGVTDPWEDHYAHFAVLPSHRLPDGTVVTTTICPAHQGISPFDIIETVHLEHKKVAAVVRSLRKSVPSLTSQPEAPVVTVWSGTDKNRKPTMRISPGSRGLITAAHLKTAKADAEAEYGVGAVDVDINSV